MGVRRRRRTGGRRGAHHPGAGVGELPGPRPPGYNGRARPGIEAPIDYAFLEAQRGGCLPVRYNPCEPTHYVINSALAPPGVVEDLREVMRKVEEATGITFVDDGPTDERATGNRTLSHARYGNRWTPILISWEHGERFRMDASNPGAGSRPQSTTCT